MEKENQRVAISKRLLKEALLRLLKEKEINKISITELCHEAEINRATFYRHYNAPQDVLADIEMELFERARDVMPLPETATRVKPYLEKLFACIYDQAEIIRLLIRSNAETHLIHMFDEFNLVMLESRIVAKDSFPVDKDDQKLLSAFLSGGGYHLLRAWLMEDVQKTPKEIAQFIYELLSRNVDSYSVR